MWSSHASLKFPLCRSLDGDVRFKCRGLLAGGSNCRRKSRKGSVGFPTKLSQKKQEFLSQLFRIAERNMRFRQKLYVTRILIGVKEALSRLGKKSGLSVAQELHLPVYASRWRRM